MWIALRCETKVCETPRVAASPARLARVRMAWATSLACSMRDRLPGLRLRASTELICNNMLCEKVGETCLCKLSMCLERMHHLRHLDLRGNRLDRLPEVWRLPHLETLDVRDNALESLPEELSSMKSLSVLQVEGNPLKSVPDSLRGMLQRSGKESISQHTSNGCGDHHRGTAAE